MSHINIGFDHMVRWDSVMLVIPGGTKMAKRRKMAAEKDGILQDCSHKRGYGSMLVMDNGWVLISHLKPATLLARASGTVDRTPFDGIGGPLEFTPPEEEGGGDDSNVDPSSSLPQVPQPGEPGFQPVQDELGTHDTMADVPEPKPGLTLLESMERAEKSNRG